MMISKESDVLGSAVHYPDLNYFLAWFRNFVGGFLNGDQEAEKNIRIKREHSLRVLALAQEILVTVALTPELRALAEIAALLHDVGRFPQYQRYGTFRDQVSVNHGSEGVRTLKRSRVLAPLPLAAQRLVLAAVCLHNRRHLPPGLPEPVRLITQVVRDADKLDIISVLVQQFQPQVPYNKVVSAGLRPHPTNYTPEILAQVRQRRQVDYNQMVWLNDFKLLLCSWLYDLNFPGSLWLLTKRGLLAALLASLPLAPEFAALRQQLHQDLETRLAGRSFE